MYTIRDIYQFLQKEAAVADAKADSELVQDLGLYGDDFHETIEAYAKQFSVDMSGYLWYFHSSEEGVNVPGGLIFKTPDARVKRIPVTPEMLLDFANGGKWNIPYPEHQLPRYRWDLVINFIFMLAVILLIVWTCS